MKKLTLILSAILLFTLYGNAKNRAEKTELKVKTYDAIIVPGFPYKGKKWALTTKTRVLWAVHLYKTGVAKNIIFSGSAVYSEYNEAEVMAIYAREMGIPNENIFIENQAEHSTENIYYSFKIAKAEGFESIAVATDPFQMKALDKFQIFEKLPIEMLGVQFKVLRKMDRKEPTIDASSAKEKNFKSIKDRQSKKERMKGTRGEKVDWTALVDSK
jgi:uncharacterized SAM-binding protein YcdF (DUF218 family)